MFNLNKLYVNSILILAIILIAFVIFVAVNVQSANDEDYSGWQPNIQRDIERVRVHPGNAELHLQLANSYFMTGHYDAAAKEMQIGMHLSAPERRSQLWLGLGNSLIKCGRRAEARHAWKMEIIGNEVACSQWTSSKSSQQPPTPLDFRCENVLEAKKMLVKFP